MSRGFEAEGVFFEPDDGFTIVRFPQPYPFVCEDLTTVFLSANVAPRSQLASWLAARLAFLSQLDARIFTDEIEVEADGLFIVDILAVDSPNNGRVFAKLQLQVSPSEVALLGVASSTEAAERSQRAFLTVCLATPMELRDVEVRIAKPGVAEGLWRVGRKNKHLL